MPPRTRLTDEPVPRAFALRPLAAALLLAAPAIARADVLVLREVPAYTWWHGCSPTSAGMVVGYWDARGWGELISGDNDWQTNRAAVREAIASVGDGDGTTGNPGTPGTGHVGDYALYDGVDDYGHAEPHEDLSDIDPDAAHPDDCLADFMRTSRSAYGLTHGATYVSRIDNGLADYAALRGYDLTADYRGYHASTAWGHLTGEIRAARPAVMQVDSDGNGRVDHSVCAVGYRDDRGYQEYACLDTWGTSLRWERFRPVADGDGWGVHSLVKARPAGTWDTGAVAAGGPWHDAGTWSDGVPDADAFAFLPAPAAVTVDALAEARLIHNLGTLEIAADLDVGDVRNDGGQLLLAPAAACDAARVELHAGGLHLGAGASLVVTDRLALADGCVVTADAGAEVRLVGGSFRNASTSPPDLAGLEQVDLIVAGAEAACRVEVAGADLGPDPDGWNANVALGGLTVGGDGPGLLALVDETDNAGGPEALYVGQLALGRGAAVRLDGLPLYYLNGGPPRELFRGDAGLDGAVDVLDLAAVANHFGATDADWRQGDFNGDGAVDSADLATVANNFGRRTAQAGGPPGVPAPTSAGLLLAASAAVLRRRRRT